MITNSRIIHEKYRAERSERLAAALDITDISVSLVYYDLALSRRFARTALVGERITAENITSRLVRLLSLSMQEYGISAAAVQTLGIAAPVHLSLYLEDALSPTELYLRPETDIFVMPFISAAISGRFTAALMALPAENGLAADFGSSLILGGFNSDRIVCASFPLLGAFDGSAIESGMPAERGAIDEVKRDNDGAVCYGVVADAESVGIAPSAAVQAVSVMLETGTLDSDGIMTDRDNFYIGEDFYITQADVRAVQSDKARTAAAFELFLREIGQPSSAFLSGEVFSRGINAMLKIGAVPTLKCRTGFCRNSVEQGLIRCAENGLELERAYKIAAEAEDISEALRGKCDNLYIKNLPFQAELMKS